MHIHQNKNKIERVPSVLTIFIPIRNMQRRRYITQYETIK